MKTKTYTELMKLSTFEERYRYLQLDSVVGQETFGFDRILNQQFYRSREWKSVRDFVIIRDQGCDLAFPNHEIYGKVLIHHMNPISVEDILGKTDLLLNPEYLICVSHRTHQAIHYGDENLLPSAPIERRKNDTCPWKH